MIPSRGAPIDQLLSADNHVGMSLKRQISKKKKNSQAADAAVRGLA